jgi:hypothetical protein
MIRSKKITDSARGEDCTLQIAGICYNDTETVVLCHFPDESHGMGLKADDISSGFGCDKCHCVIDGRVGYLWKPGEKDWYMRRSQTRTLRKLVEKGVIRLA